MAETWYEKQELIRRTNDKSSFKNLLTWFCLPIFIGIASAAFVLALLAYLDTQTAERFNAVTDFEPDSDSLPLKRVYTHSSRIEDFDTTIAIPCTNKTLGDNTKTFSGSTTLGTPCPKTDNECSEFICGEDGYCDQRVVSGGECYDSIFCSEGFFCNSTCMCEPDLECTIDSDCVEFNANPCIEAKCTSNTCSYDLIDGAECSSPTQCSTSGLTCNSTCMCTPVSTTNICAVDADCVMDNSNPCVESKCMAGACSLELIAGATCSSTTGCTGSNTCNSTCMCEPVTFTGNCTLDSQCATDNSNPCVESVCNGGTCEINLIAGAECSSSTGCTNGNICNSTCLCEAVSPTSEFLDTEFTLQDEVNPLSMAMFSTVSGNDGTIVYQLPSLTNPTLAGTFAVTTGTATPSTFPWSSAFGTTYKIVFMGSGNGNNLVTLTMDDNIHTGGNGTDPIIYNALIPASYRPLTVPFVANVVSGDVSGTYTSVEMSVRSSGNVEFFTTGHAGFPNVASSQGHWGCSITWTT